MGDALESLTIRTGSSQGDLSNVTYHMKISGYMHVNMTYLKLYGADGSTMWVDNGYVIFKHREFDQAQVICGAAICNTLAVDTDNLKYITELFSRAQMYSNDIVR